MINKERNVFAFSETRHFSGFLAAPTLGSISESTGWVDFVSPRYYWFHWFEACPGAKHSFIEGRGLFLVHFSNVFGIDFYWINDQRLYTRKMYTFTIDFTPCRVPQKNSRIIHQSPMVIENVKKLVGFPLWWGTKNHLPLQPAKSQANWTSVGGKMEKPPKGPRLFASICHDFFKQTYTYWTTSISLFFMHFFLSLHPQNPFLLTLECNTCTYAGESYEWYDIWHITTPYCTSI